MVYRRLGDAFGAGGLQSLSAGQFEAARTQGFSAGQALRFILLPQALRNVRRRWWGFYQPAERHLAGVYRQRAGAHHRRRPVNNRVQIYPLAIFVFTGAVYYLLCCGLSLLANRRFTGRNADRRYAGG